MKRLVLIDAHSVLYRSYFAFIRNPLRNSKGENTSTIFGFANTIKKVLRELQPEFSAVVFDAPGKTFRDELFREYKAQRPKTPDELVRSIPVVKKLVRAWGLKDFEVSGVEADDVIGTLAQKAKAQGIEVVIVSSDKDMLQLVDNLIVVFEPWKERFYSSKDVKERLGIRPEQVPDFLALAGDAVDNVPGVPGIGPKRALSLLVKYGSLKAALEQDEKLRKYQELVRLSMDLVRINTSAPVAISLEELRLVEPDWRKISSIYRELEFYSLFKDVIGKNGVEEDFNGLVFVGHKSERLSQIFKANAIGFEFEPEKGIWVTTGDKEVVLVPKDERSLIARLLSEGQYVLVGFNIKEQLKGLHRAGFDLTGKVFDVGVGAWLIDPNRKRFDPKDTIAQVLEKTVEIRERFELPIWAMRLYSKLLPEISALGLNSVCEELEMLLIFVLARMEERGVTIDPEIFSRINH
ncbi:MAG: 5'-3' exonuclease H3TH domain-containing protein, partial [bacterium]